MDICFICNFYGYIDKVNVSYCILFILFYVLIDNIFHSKPEKQDLLELLACISYQWQIIGEALGVPYSVLMSLLQMNSDNKNKLSSVLQCWMDQCTTKATWNSIISAIEGEIVGQKTVAEKIRKHVLSINLSRSNGHKQALEESSSERKGSYASMSSSSAQKEFKSRNKGDDNIM